MPQPIIQIALPLPWKDRPPFQLNAPGDIVFLVGPNGSGKSRFAAALKSAVSGRLLGTDRLHFMATIRDYGDRFAQGYGKGEFGHLKALGDKENIALDTFVILDERPDVRVKVEATLTRLFSRRIWLEWSSGYLVPKVLLENSSSYRIDREECHGIRELLVLLTHLYNEQWANLIIDEPELNLHPQYQSFFMQEVRKTIIAANKNNENKRVVLITHSPFIVDLRSFDDVASVFCFSANHTLPKNLTDVVEADKNTVSAMVPRLNVHHKQLFFSDNPIFVEGVFDAAIIEAIQERRGVSITAAGSCIIDAGGCEEVTKYVRLCRGFGKEAFFFYDLDSLFTRSLRGCIRADHKVTDFLAQIGVGDDFSRYCGELDSALGDALPTILASTKEDQDLSLLRAHLEKLAVDGKFTGKNLVKARVALLIAIGRHREKIEEVLDKATLRVIEGRRDKISEVLAHRNVVLLSHGALEHYLPSFSGNIYSLDEDAKRTAVQAEIEYLTTSATEDDLPARYGKLFECICKLPGSAKVDLDDFIKSYASEYIHALQGQVLEHPDWSADELNSFLRQMPSNLSKLFHVAEFARLGPSKFEATIRVSEREKTFIRISDRTNAGMRDFVLERPAIAQN